MDGLWTWIEAFKNTKRKTRSHGEVVQVEAAIVPALSGGGKRETGNGAEVRGYLYRLHDL